MRSEELDVRVVVVQERQDETPCFRAFLDVEEFLLKTPLISRRKMIVRCIRLLDELFCIYLWDGEDLEVTPYLSRTLYIAGGEHW